jgi:hypothetical protein
METLPQLFYLWISRFAFSMATAEERFIWTVKRSSSPVTGGEVSIEGGIFLKQKKRLFNAIMVVLILVVIAGGVMLVGETKGWFTKADIPRATAGELVGSVEIERSGVAYSATDGLILQDGDVLTTAASSHVTLRTGNSSLVLDEGAGVRVLTAAADGFSVEITAGQVYCTVPDRVLLTVSGQTVDLSGTVVAADVQAGCATLACLSGTVTLPGGTAVQSGQSLSLLDSGHQVAALSAAHLNEFALTQALGANSTLCFTPQDIQSVLDARTAEKEAALTTPDVAPDNETAPVGGSSPVTPAPSGDSAPAGPTCSLEIRCDTILSHLDDLAAGKNAYVPSGGIILSATSVSFTDGETVFDILKRVCEARSIQLEYSWTPMYNSYYVEGINNLYEFDCGSESGWMYKVNGWFPNYGCSSYALKDGDTIVFCYTCEGLGSDVGGSVN